MQRIDDGHNNQHPDDPADGTDEESGELAAVSGDSLNEIVLQVAAEDEADQEAGGGQLALFQQYLHCLLVGRLIAQTVSSRQAPGEGFEKADLLPELSQVLNLCDRLK